MKLQKPDNILRQINRRIDEIVGAFGMQSPEYMRIKAALGTVKGVYSMTIFGSFDKPSKLSRAKKVQKAIEGNVELHTQLQNAWNAIKAQGTVKQQKKKYFSPTIQNELIGAGLSTDDIDDRIKEAARREYEANFYDDDVYEKYKQLADEAAETGDEELAATLEDMYHLFKYKPSSSKENQDWKYDTIVDMLKKAEEDHKQWLIDSIINDDLGDFDMSM
jgi:hypothetical protein